jgi:uncharacterized protein YukE
MSGNEGSIVAGDIRVDSGALEHAGGKLTGEAKEISTALDELRKALDAQRSPWGGDEIGARFGREYTEFVTQAFAAIGTYQDQVADTGGAHRDDAKCWVDLERYNTKQLRLLEPGPGR